MLPTPYNIETESSLAPEGDGSRVPSRGDTEPSVADPTVVLVEDDPELRNVLGRGLREEGFSVRTAATGARLFEHVENEVPDVFVLDVGLPDSDGRDLCQALRARGVQPRSCS